MSIELFVVRGDVIVSADIRPTEHVAGISLIKVIYQFGNVYAKNIDLAISRMVLARRHAQSRTGNSSRYYSMYRTQPSTRSVEDGDCRQ
jgi:hypothetical protein